MNEFRFINLLGATGTIRRETWEGREHLVVPVVALVEGAVRAMNAKGYEMVRAEKFGVAPFAWDGRPLMAGHPVEHGVPISANDPRVLARSFGRVHNTKVEGKRLLMEAWIDIEKARSMPSSLEVLERCLAHERGDAGAKPIEVSVGAGVTVKDESGTHGDRAYKGSWDTIMPDHLALLAEAQVGACSVAMGCGALRAAVLEDSGFRFLEGQQEIDMAVRDLSALDPLSPEFLRLLRSIPPSDLAAAPSKDFAGPNRSFPILAPGDVAAAAQALGRAKGDRGAIKQQIIAIAKRKGWESSLPDAWKPQQKNLVARMLEKARELLRLAQTPDDMTDLNLRTKLSDALDDLDPDFQNVEAFWPINDPSHVVYMCQEVSEAQPDPLPYPGYVSYDYDLYERPFTIDASGIVTLGTAKIEVVPVVRYEPSEGATPEADDPRMLAASLYALAGKRHSAADEGMIQTVHDQAVSLGATCAESRMAAAHGCSCRNNQNNKEADMDRSKTIAALAAHPHSAITDLKVLEKLDDATLTALQASADATAVTVKAAKDGQATAEVALKAAQDALAAPVTEERLPAEYRTLMAERRDAETVEKTELVVTLKAAQMAYTEVELQAKPLPELRKLALVAKATVPSHIGRPVPRVAAAGDARSFAPPDAYATGLKALQGGKQVSA